MTEEAMERGRRRAEAGAQWGQPHRRQKGRGWQRVRCSETQQLRRCRTLHSSLSVAAPLPATRWPYRLLLLRYQRIGLLPRWRRRKRKKGRSASAAERAGAARWRTPATAAERGQKKRPLSCHAAVVCEGKTLRAAAAELYPRPAAPPPSGDSSPQSYSPTANP